MTVTVKHLATGEELALEANTVDQLKHEIQRAKGIPCEQQVIQDIHGKPIPKTKKLKDGGKYVMAMNLNGGCGAGCNCCGMGADCGCCII